MKEIFNFQFSIFNLSRKTDKIISFFYYSLFFFVPLAMASFTSELFEFNKMMFIYLVALGIVFFCCLKMLLAKKIIIKKTPFDIPILLFLGSQILSSIFSIDRPTSIFGYYGRFNGGLLSIISYIILYYAFVSNISLEYIQRILKISLTASFFVILWGLPGRFGHDFSCLLFMGQFNNSCWTDQFRPAERMFSTLGQPNWLGAYLAINFFIGLYFYLKRNGQDNVLSLQKILIFLYLILNFTSILFTRSRSALAAVILGIFFFLLFSIFRKNSINHVSAKRLIAIIFVLIIPIIFFKTGVEKIDKFISVSSYLKAKRSTASVKRGLIQQPATAITESGDIRKIVWKGAIDLGMRYPLFGSGVETFAYSYYFVRAKEHNLTSEWDFLYNKAHNEYLNYLATTGFVGLGGYLLMIGAIFIYFTSKIFNFQFSIFNQFSMFQNLKIKNLLKISNFKFKINDSLLVICLLLSYLTILITNFFGFSTTTINLFFYLIPAFLFVLSPDQQTKTINNQQSTISNLSWLQRILFLFLLLSAFYLLLSLFKYYLADIKYAQGENFSKVGEYQNAAKLLHDAYNLKHDHVYEDKLSYVLANVAFIASYQKENDLAKKMVQTSDALNRKSLQTSPKNVLYWKTRAKDYYLFYQISLNKKDLEVGIEALKEAAKLSPTDPKIFYSLAIFNSLLEEETKDLKSKSELQQLSLKYIDTSIQLKPDFRDGYFLKGQLLKKAGKMDEAKKAFKFILENLNPNDQEAKKEIGNL